METKKIVTIIVGVSILVAVSYMLSKHFLLKTGNSGCGCGLDNSDPGKSTDTPVKTDNTNNQSLSDSQRISVTLERQEIELFPQDMMQEFDLPVINNNIQGN